MQGASWHITPKRQKNRENWYPPPYVQWPLISALLPGGGNFQLFLPSYRGKTQKKLPSSRTAHMGIGADLILKKGGPGHGSTFLEPTGRLWSEFCVWVRTPVLLPPNWPILEQKMSFFDGLECCNCEGKWVGFQGISFLERWKKRFFSENSVNLNVVMTRSVDKDVA